MEDFIDDSLSELYPSICQELVKYGKPVRPRGQLTKEMLDVTIQLDDPTDVVLHPTIGRVGYRSAIGAAEGLLLVAGVSDPALMARISPAFERFMDGGALHGAYGPRIRTQVPRMIDRMADDPATRQAVVMIWDPLHDGAEPEQEPPRDLPCTVYLSFRIRDGKLSLKTHMRSNDAWLGLPYDVLQFTLLQKTVANVLGMEAGPYVHHVDSLHLYERHWGLAEETRFAHAESLKVGGLVVHTWSQARQTAYDLLYNDDVVYETRPTERWLNAQLSPFRS